MIEQDVSARLHPGVIELQREVLRSGHPLRIRLHGMSMYPFIRGGDVALVRPVAWTDFRRGDVILYERESRLVAHRVLVPPFDDRSPLIAKGDTLSNYDPPVRAEQLLGRVEALERNGRAVSLLDRRGFMLQRIAAELSGPYSTLFWKVAAARRRTLKGCLRFAAYRAHRRRNCPFTLQTRHYQPDDLDALANCLWDLRLSFNFARMREWTGEQVARLQEAGAKLLVAEDGRRIVGVAALSQPLTEDGAIRIEIYLHPLVRGYGWGEQLLSILEREAADSGASALAVMLPDTSRAARRLLRKRGWRSDPPPHDVESSDTDKPPVGFQAAPEGPATLWTLPLQPAPQPSREPAIGQGV